jgi:transposase
VRPFGAAVALVDSIPGIALRSAEAILAEIGPDMSRFPTAAHLASWARVCPGNDESAGRRRSGASGSGNHWLRTALVEAAHAAARTKGTYLAAQYKRISARRGSKRAALAVAHTILVIVYHLLRDGEMYRELGPTWFDERDRTATIRRAVRRIEALGYSVTVEPAA